MSLSSARPMMMSGLTRSYAKPASASADVAPLSGSALEDATMSCGRVRAASRSATPQRRPGAMAIDWSTPVERARPHASGVKHLERWHRRRRLRPRCTGMCRAHRTPASSDCEARLLARRRLRCPPRRPLDPASAGRGGSLDCPVGRSRATVPQHRHHCADRAALARSPDRPSRSA